MLINHVLQLNVFFLLLTVNLNSDFPHKNSFKIVIKVFHTIFLQMNYLDNKIIRTIQHVGSKLTIAFSCEPTLAGGTIDASDIWVFNCYRPSSLKRNTLV